MKTTFTFACSVAIMNVFSFAHAQDTTLAKIDSRLSSKPVSAKEVQVNMPTEISRSQSAATAVPAAFDLSVVKKNSDRSILNNKVGPNGEELFMKKNKYFCLNEKGKKVKVKSSMLRDRAKHS